QPVVQILVVVAIKQMGTLLTEVGKGSMRTVVAHGLVDPKVDINGNVSELGDAGGSPGKSYLFFLT
ncbi:hypothetical protein ROZALSC1DRAFT_6238, partial [Rozella allomycis CSF55]